MQENYETVCKRKLIYHFNIFGVEFLGELPAVASTDILVLLTSCVGITSFPSTAKISSKYSSNLSNSEKNEATPGRNFLYKISSKLGISSKLFFGIHLYTWTLLLVLPASIMIPYWWRRGWDEAKKIEQKPKITPGSIAPELWMEKEENNMLNVTLFPSIRLKSSPILNYNSWLFIHLCHVRIALLDNVFWCFTAYSTVVLLILQIIKCFNKYNKNTTCT